MEGRRKKNPVTPTARIKTEKLQPGGEGFLPKGLYSQTSKAVSADVTKGKGKTMVGARGAQPLPLPVLFSNKKNP